MIGTGPQGFCVGFLPGQSKKLPPHSSNLKAQEKQDG